MEKIEKQALTEESIRKVNEIVDLALSAVADFHYGECGRESLFTENQITQITEMVKALTSQPLKDVKEDGGESLLKALVGEYPLS